MGQVFVEKEDVGRRERYFCLFPNDIIILSVGIELSGYCFEVFTMVCSNVCQNGIQGRISSYV